MRILAQSVVVAAALLLAACGSTPIAEDLNQTQATEIVATLTAAGIAAEASRATGGGTARYSVVVNHGVYAQAVSLLHEKGLPSEPRASFSELIAPRGLMPNTREIEALRLDRALAADLEETLLQLPSVGAARVMVRLHLPESAGKPAVSAVIVPRPSRAVEAKEVRDLIARGVPGINPGAILIVIEQAWKGPNEGRIHGSSASLTSFLWLWRVPEEDYNSLAFTMVLGVLGLFLGGTVVGYALTRFLTASLGRGTVLRKRASRTEDS